MADRRRARSSDSNGSGHLAITYRKVDELEPYQANPRKHSPEQVEQIAASIREFGFTNPVLLDGASGVIAGHGRIAAARMLGLESVPCVDLAHLTKDQRRAYRIADNQIARNASWDEWILKVELAGLKDAGADLALLGFDPAELADIMYGEAPADQDDAQGGGAGEQKMVTCPKCGHTFAK